ncbi:MAG: helix-turn-helix transcriptional regulator, partial [Acidithiobacillus sp.]|nr:helix-turn-helix transcriptional regulator [Acidithiobacillus sp.]
MPIENNKEDSMQCTEEVMRLLKENPPKTGLDYIMRLRGITNAELAKKLNTDPQRVSSWRHGTIPAREVATEVANLL